jgi:hypothetical protein
VGLCENSYGNPFKRFRATRIDRQIDFGPTDWNLSFINDNRFNYYAWVDGITPRERLPFAVHWRGHVSHPTPRDISVTYVGAADLLVGTARIRLDASHDRPRTVDLRIPAGRQRVLVTYRFDDESRTGPSDLPEDREPIATFRIRVKGAGQDVPLRAESPRLVWRAAGYAVDLLSLGAAFVLLWFYGTILLVRWPLLLVASAGVWLSYDHAASFEILTADGVVVLSLLALGVALLSSWRGSAAFCAAYWGVALLVLAHEATLAESLQSVLLRRGGTDALTYESLAREILDTWSLRGGEDVFYYQPLFRYTRFVERLLLGDGDVLVAAFAMASLIVSVLWMVWTSTVSGYLSKIVSFTSLALLLVLLNSFFVVDLLRRSHSEYPTWVALPLLMSLLFGPNASRLALGSSLVGMSLITRFNQAPALLWLLGARFSRLAQWPKRTTVLAAVVVVSIMLMPAVHNLYYGGELVFTTRSAEITENLILRPADYWLALRDEEARARVTRHLGRLFYDAAANDEPYPMDGGGLRPVFRGLQILWLAAILSLFVSGSVRLVGRRPGVRCKLHPLRLAHFRHLMILCVPVVYLAPHLFYQANPRHIVVAHLAMAMTTLYGVGVARPDLQSDSLGR